MNTITNHKGIVLPLVLALVCIVGIITAATIKTTSRFHWLVRAAKQESYRQVVSPIVNISNPCNDATCLSGKQATHVIANIDTRIVSVPTDDTLLFWAILKNISTVFACDGTHDYSNILTHSSAYNCSHPLKLLIKNNSMIYFSGNYHSEQNEEISNFKSRKVTITTQGFFKIKQLDLNRLENVIVEIISAGAILIDKIALTESKEVTIYLYSALGDIEVNINNQISANCLSHKNSPGLIIPESKKRIKINRIELSQSNSCHFSKDPSYWRAGLQIGM